ncbi:MAG: hypothetical protein NC938_02070 [Candidatus Omnitrophica bacterium]|nr:hypothetical protein [Candidatus Omnitrophota bacterium]
MPKKIKVFAVVVIFGVLCGIAKAGPLENASEFQQKIVDAEEQQAEDKMASQASESDITWDDSGEDSGASQKDVTEGQTE